MYGITMAETFGKQVPVVEQELTEGMQRKRIRVPIWEKGLLTLEEAAEYTGLGLQKLRTISNDENCDFVLWNGSKRMFKRKKLDAYLDNAYSI